MGEKLVDGKQVELEHPNKVWIRHTYNVDEAPQQVSYFKKRGVQLEIDGPPPPLYEHYPIPIEGLRGKVD